MQIVVRNDGGKEALVVEVEPPALLLLYAQLSDEQNVACSGWSCWACCGGESGEVGVHVVVARSRSSTTVL